MYVSIDKLLSSYHFQDRTYDINNKHANKFIVMSTFKANLYLPKCVKIYTDL